MESCKTERIVVAMVAIASLGLLSYTLTMWSLGQVSPSTGALVLFLIAQPLFTLWLLYRLKQLGMSYLKVGILVVCASLFGAITAWRLGASAIYAYIGILFVAWLCMTPLFRKKSS